MMHVIGGSSPTVALGVEHPGSAVFGKISGFVANTNLCAAKVQTKAQKENPASGASPEPSTKHGSLFHCEGLLLKIPNYVCV